MSLSVHSMITWMWKLLLVGVNYLASLLDTCIFRPGWLSDQDTILHMLVGCEPENQELENQHWTSSNPHRLWQCIKQIKPSWQGPSQKREIQREGLCLASINRQFIQSALWIWDWISFFLLEIHSETKYACYECRHLLGCQWKCLQQEVLCKWDVFIPEK